MEMPRKKSRRNDWGSIVERRNKQGEVTRLEARYPNPKNPKQRIAKSFSVNERMRAQAWLDKERKLVDEFERGVSDWAPPKERETQVAQSHITFSEYADEYLENYSVSLTEATKRQKRTSISHLKDAFGSMLLWEITSAHIDAWLISSRSFGLTAQRNAFIELKAIMRKAATPAGSQPALIESSPIIQKTPPRPKSQQAKIPPATPEEIHAIYNAMPDYTRISIYLAVVFSLRISEVCALQVKDIDLTRKTLHIRHALARGKDDKGDLHLAPTKTESSMTSMAIPDAMIPILNAHIHTYCDTNDPEAMLIKPVNTHIMNPNSLRNQFDIARKKANRPDLHFHTLRATGITEAVYQGATMKETQVYGRHADATVSLEHYQRAKEGSTSTLTTKVFDALIEPDSNPEQIRARIDSITKKIHELEAERSKLEALLKPQ
ncbi:tyrosine-type recombinase/integrase [Alloscardovia omnicolens]|uniref:tyrosine-type recombinase/integrase n=1 Tax=Alloscardovia omnicolens TaxID=419015 RepID=UPI0003B4D9C0|nr:site-specific integrase [Alloscardovia omnicolens]